MKNSIKSKLVFLKPEQIVCPNTFVRKHYDDFDIKILADSIAANGIIEPIIVRNPKKGIYELVAGLRRLKAAQTLGLRRVPSIIITADNRTAAYISITENTKRTSLNPFEEAEAIKNVINRYETDISVAAEKLGVASSYLTGKLNLLKLDNLSKTKIISCGLGERYAKITLLVPEEKRSEFLDEIIKNSVCISGAKELANKYISEETPEEKETLNQTPVRKTVIGDERLFANSLSKLISTMQSSGLEAYQRKSETEKYIEYRVRIVKNQPENYRQIRLV